MPKIREAAAQLRQEYLSAPLDCNQLLNDPIEQFHRWFEEAINAEVTEPNAMSLATSTPDGFPSCRTVLMKDCDDRGFVFFTNYSSRKGQELEQNPKAALLFHWRPLHRQVLVRGTVHKVSRDESEEYFHSRPIDSQLGAWASIQSSVIPSRAYLEQRFTDLAEEHANQTVPLPEYWGGYCVNPQEIEFWQGRKNRMHDRILYRKTDERWDRDRLSP